jgi:hypothetical protein
LVLTLLVGTSASVQSATGEVRSVTRLTQTTATSPSAQGKTDLRIQQGRVDFKVEIVGLPVGRYTLLVNGTRQGSINVVADELGTTGEIEFRNTTSSNKQFLGFNPAGAKIEIAQPNGVVVFKGVLASASTDDPSSSSNDIEFTLPAISPQSSATGDLEYKVGPDWTRFEVQIENMEPGSYNLFVDGDNVGSIQASLSSDDDSNDNADDNSDDDPNDHADDNSDDDPNDHADDNSDDDPNDHPDDNSNDNSSDDFNSSISGRQLARSKRVATVSSDSGSEGEIVFQDPVGSNPNTFPLNFDPRGKVVEVRQGGVVILSGVFPTTSTDPTTSSGDDDPSGCTGASDLNGDLNGDGMVDSVDMRILLANFGPIVQDNVPAPTPRSPRSPRSRRR